MEFEGDLGAGIGFKGGYPEGKRSTQPFSA